MMSYNDVAQMAFTNSLSKRITACAAIEGESSAPSWTGQNIWAVVAAPGWGAAWSYAMDSNPDADPEVVGADEGVITDGMILSSVQAVRGAGELMVEERVIGD